MNQSNRGDFALAVDPIGISVVTPRRAEHAPKRHSSLSWQPRGINGTPRSSTKWLLYQVQWTRLSEHRGRMNT